jgi:large subunit ribosomal protein L9
MKVILQQDVRGQGKKGQLVEVSDGYARNFLFPRKLAVAATTDNVNTMKLQDQARKEREAKEKAEAEALVKKLKDCPVKLTAKAGAGGKLFGSVTTKEVAAALKEQYGFQVDSKKLSCDPIKSFGTFQVKCKLGYEVSGTVTVIVEEG